MPRTVEISFTGCTQADESLGARPDEVRSTVHFDLKIGAELLRGLSVVVRHPRRSQDPSRSVLDGLEVEKPPGRTGSVWNQHEFASAARAYYLMLFSPAAQGFHTGTGSLWTAANSYFSRRWTTRIEVPDDGSAPW